MSSSPPLFQIDKMQVRFRTPDGEVHAVKGASVSVGERETVAIVGESGSGKSQLVMAATGLIASNGRAEGSARYRGQELIGLSQHDLNRYRGRHIGMIFQEPMTSLDPLYTVGNQIVEPLRRHSGLGAAEARKRAIELMQLVRIPRAGERLASYPHELSGGQRQRVMIAMAIANNPDLLIADEPTTALDVTIQAEILALLKDLQDRLGMGMLFITHDLNIVRRIAQRVVVMRKGEVVEEGPTAELFGAPRHPYTKALLAAEPTGRKRPVSASAPDILEGRDVKVSFGGKAGLLDRLFGIVPRAIIAVDGVDIRLRQGQTIGIVGESGSGKSTLARALLRMLPSEGRIAFAGKDITATDASHLRPLRRSLQIVFQDPFGSLSPRLTAGQIVTEGLLVHEPGLSGKERDRRAATAFEEVQLEPLHRNRYPHEFSGGQRQRIAIARAIILRPRVVVLDEPTSALDRQVQKQIVELLRSLQAQSDLSYLFISHDLAVVRAMADHVMVMKDGVVVEQGSPEELFAAPKQAYTQRLISAAFAGVATATGA